MISGAVAEGRGTGPLAAVSRMNGGWFWWGKKTGESGYAALYRMLFERLTTVHRLNNLI